MLTIRRALAVGALLTVSAMPALAAHDADSLFREEIIDANAKLGLKGITLDDTTRFTVAASGLSWRPSHDGAPLFVAGKRATIYSQASVRKQAFEALARRGESKQAFAYALSLVLAPPDNDGAAWLAAYGYLSQYDTGFDRALSGVLQTPDKLPLLPAYRYAAVDALVHRSSVRLLPFFMTLEGSDDRYLRSRAVVAIGRIGYRERKGAKTVAGFVPPVEEVSISAVQQRMMADAVRQAANDGSYHVRAAAALALGLLGDEADIPLLEKLAKDRACVIRSEGKDTKQLFFPVRTQAIASLKRFGREAQDTNGSFSGKELKQAMKGAQNVTDDHSGLRRDQFPGMPFCNGIW